MASSFRAAISPWVLTPGVPPWYDGCNGGSDMDKVILAFIAGAVSLQLVLMAMEMFLCMTAPFGCVG